MKSLWDEFNGPGAEINYLGGRGVYDPLPDFNCNDPKPATIPRVSRVLGIVKWIGGAVVLIGIGVCVLSVAVLDYLEWAAR